MSPQGKLFRQFDSLSGVENTLSFLQLIFRVLCPPKEFQVRIDTTITDVLVVGNACLHYPSADYTEDIRDNCDPGNYYRHPRRSHALASLRFAGRDIPSDPAARADIAQSQGSAASSSIS